MLSDRKPLSAGFSEDGYIIDQDCFHEYRYRTMRADINSCGWIAAYNLRHFLGQDAEWDDVRQEMEGMHVLNIPGPTHMRVMRQYLNKYISGVMISYGKEQALEAAKTSAAGIFRYREENIPHFISYTRAEGGKFRFFNVTENKEDILMPMEQFGREHLLNGRVIVLTVEMPDPKEKQDLALE
jgi:hypothetical protein